MIIELHDLESLAERRLDQAVPLIAVELIVSALKRNRHNLEDTIAAAAIIDAEPDCLRNRLSAVGRE
jgi:hypothetical protein